MRESQYLGDHIVQEAEKYLLYDQKTGETKVTKLLPRNLKSMFSRKVHDATKPYHSTDMFVDDRFVANNLEIAGIQANRGKVVYKRLIHLCPKNHRFPFFPPDPTDNVCFKVGNPSQAPHFLFELGLFPTSHYRSMFICQDYSEVGRYEVIVNSQGRFQMQVVDDLIPVFQANEKPIWGMDIQYPWQLILAKVWAKRCGGYAETMEKQPMQFLKTFSNSNWKYFNMAHEADFLRNFVGKQWSQIVVKTKNNNEVKQSGLIPDEVAYKVLEIREEDNEITVVLKSTVKNKWTGNMSVVDNRNTLLHSQITAKSKVTLDKDIIIPATDFYNMFSAAYVTSKRPHSYSDYYILEVPPHTKNAIYLEFYFQNDGFIDFSIKQFESNKRNPTENSQFGHKNVREENSKKEIKEDEVQRYQKVKYALIFSVERGEAPSRFIFLEDENLQSQVQKSQPNANYGNQLGFELNESKSNALNNSRFYDELGKSQYLEPEEAREEREVREEDFEPLQYDCYEIQYNKGYSAGEANFLNVEKGWYTLRIKTETSDRVTKYVFNYTTNEPIKVKETKLEKSDQSLMFRQVMISMCHSVPNISLSKENYEVIASGNEFESIGYGFIAIRLKRKAPYSLILEVNPMELADGGYSVKDQFKHLKETYGLFVNPGESTCLIFKKLPGFAQYKWPPPGVQIYKEKLKEQGKKK